MKASLFVLSLLVFLHTKSSAAFKVTVAKDGSGNFRTIKDAVGAAPTNSDALSFIHVKEGIYVENVIVDKPNIVLIGSGAEKTTITGSLNAHGGYGIFQSPTLAVQADNFTLQYITVENSAGPEAGQAVALLSNSNHSVFYKSAIIGNQDTLFANKGNQFYRDCDVYGTVDFIFGGATAVFQNCNLYVRRPGSIITAHSRETADASGYVIQNCTLTVSPELEKRNVSAGNNSFLGRAWRSFARVIVMESYLDDVIDRTGWTVMRGVGVENVTFEEYKNRGGGADTSGRVTWKGFKVLKRVEEAEPYVATNFIDGDSWIPRTGIPYYGGFAAPAASSNVE